MSRSPQLLFADRLVEGCRYHKEAPADYGQQAWIRRELHRLGTDVSSTAVSNWFAGYTHPRPEMVSKLAQILGVTEAWLTGEDNAHCDKAPSTDTGKSSIVAGNREPQLDTFNITVPIRTSVKVRIEDIPADLSGPEAQKIANVILALASLKD